MRDADHDLELRNTLSEAHLKPCSKCGRITYGKVCKPCSKKAVAVSQESLQAFLLAGGEIKKCPDRAISNSPRTKPKRRWGVKKYIDLK